MPYSADAKGTEFGLVGRIPIGERFAATARIDKHWWESTFDTTGIHISESGNSVSYGAGVSFDLNDRWTLTGMWQRFDLFDTEIDHISVGIRLRFGTASSE